jgi:hypothetical protein
MGRYKRFTAFLILLLLVATFAAVVHHHDNTGDDHSCSICLLSHHHQATSQSTVAFDGTPFITKTTYASPASDLPGHIVISLIRDRAPPA